MKRIFIIHRWSSGPEGDWRPWLKSELTQLGYEVTAPQMPDTAVPKIEKWVGYLSELVGKADSQTYFVGHSIGCQTILRYLQTQDEIVGGAVFVAGWFNLENLEYAEVRRIAKPWIETPLDKEKLKKVLPKSTLLISDNDPYDCRDENVKGFTELGANIVTVPEAGHFTGVDGYEQFTLLLDEFKKLSL
jgi:uncharacterized protein